MSGSDFDKLDAAGDNATAQDESAAQLEQRYAALRAKMGEERYIWTLVVILLVDFVVFERIGNWAASLAIMAIEAVLLVVIARKCGVPDVIMLIDKIGDFYGRAKRPPSASHDNENNA